MHRSLLLFLLPLVWAGPVYPAFATAQPAPDDSTEPPGDTNRELENEGEDLWDFDDEEEDVETWGALVRDQAPDLALFTLFATLTLVSFFRKSAWLKYVTFVAAIGYMAASLDDSNERYADVAKISLEAISAFADDVRGGRQIRGGGFVPPTK